ncbi:dihydrolipoyl dehydrogenase [Truepera radiovictrix]|uniref:Dihydrolipoyl dehydrogenase n=1 Tax=Truepera radiovictrix (strain DSM 17093 / CIP 108686 / LMG 22925 / RQ-24) TaxID=649638 RepID=D7CUP2_TRURR|nr:dihydrolipoyl dehydrogenase [Truepera radiovictrix]ADI14033.1 dihydrolipoamide dehydrogenase [Truepera radiovictrix DSM 17093]WMT57407.1 dihydrolipoyl dehydrogenase [Truepera radiovictrix]
MAQHDLIVIGAGPGGYVAAIRAAQLGFDVACVEKEADLGGTCLRVGCIPSKALLESSEKFLETQGALKEHGIEVAEASLNLAAMHARKDKVVKSLTSGIAGLFKKNKVTRYEGAARFEGPNKLVVAGKNGEETLGAERIIIATGSKSVVLPGIELDGERVGTSTDALAYPEVPEHLVVIGAGYIGLELGSVWKRLGAKVTVVEYLDRILPGMDGEIAKEALKVFKKQGLEFRLGARVTSARAQGEGAVVEIDGQEPLHAERVLVAVGRQPNTDGLNVEAIGLELDARGFIPVDAHYRTKIPGIYAIGDVIGGAMLAHKAEEEGVACVEGIATGVGHVNYGAIPGVAYTEPEIASVGKTEEQLKEEGIKYKKGVFPFLANGRARALGHTEGKVKILADAETDRVLGVHIIGSRAGDLIAEAVAALEFGASAEDLARTSHAHPTLAEALKEAALAVDGRALHI